MQAKSDRQYPKVTPKRAGASPTFLTVQYLTLLVYSACSMGSEAVHKKFSREIRETHEIRFVPIFFAYFRVFRGQKKPPEIFSHRCTQINTDKERYFLYLICVYPFNLCSSVAKKILFPVGKPRHIRKVTSYSENHVISGKVAFQFVLEFASLVREQIFDKLSRES